MAGKKRKGESRKKALKKFCEKVDRSSRFKSKPLIRTRYSSYFYMPHPRP